MSSRFSRKTDRRNIRRRILILCEGETEVTYFNGFKRAKEANNENIIIVMKSKYQNPQGIMEYAKRLYESNKGTPDGYDKVWCIFDRDYDQNNDSIREQFNNAISFFNQNPGFGAAFSIKCFEVWLLMHFDQECLTISRGRLKNRVKERCGENYTNNLELYDRLREYQEHAIKYAQNFNDQHDSCNTHQFDRDPSSQIYHLIYELRDAN